MFPDNGLHAFLFGLGPAKRIECPTSLYLAMDDTGKLKDAAILDLVLSLFPEYRECSLHKESECGCILIGIVASGQATRLVPLDKEACEKTIERLPQPEAHFWKKRIAWDIAARNQDGIDTSNRKRRNVQG